MPKLRDLSGKKLVKIFESFGFSTISQKGSHIKMCRVTNNKEEILVIPNHPSVAKGTLKNIYAQAREFLTEKELKTNFYS